MNSYSKAFVSYTNQEIDFILSCITGVLICGLYKRFRAINIDIKPTITKLTRNGLIFKRDNIYILTNKGRKFIQNLH